MMSVIMKIACIFLITLSNYSIAEVQNVFSLGAGANLNYAPDTNVPVLLDSEISIRPAVGIKSMLKFEENWSLRSALIAQSKSARFRTRRQGIDGDLEAKVIYASIPVNLQLKLNEDISVFGGYIADIAINDYCTRDGDYKTCEIGSAKSLANVATLGASVMGATSWEVDISYQHGLTEAFENIKIHTFQVMAFYRLE